MGGKYVAYPEYKESGTEWLSEIPVSWFSLSLGKVVEFMNNGSSATQVEEGEETVRITRIETISGGMINLEKIGYVKRYDISSRFILKKGDIQFSNINSLNMVGNCAIFDVDQELFAGMNLLHIRPEFSRVYSRYMIYQFKTKWFRNRVEASAKPAINQASIPTGTLKHFYFLCPSLPEQQKIASFLDHETAKIDTLIEKQQKRIKLLKEKRQAVISHAVTKGLPSSTGGNAPMRDSGVEWLGEVPEHWSVKRLKHISAKVGVGLVINPSTYTRDEGVYFIFGGDVKEYQFDLSKTRRISVEDSDSLLPSRLNHQDLISIRVGYPGITAVVSEELEGSNCASVIIIRRGLFNSDWLCAAMNVWVGRQQVDLVSYGAAQKQFNVADAIEFVFPVPPESEQEKIADFVRHTLNRFNALADKAEQQIELLKERRTALISAAVTGKIDVRSWQAPEPSTTTTNKNKEVAV